MKLEKLDTLVNKNEAIAEQLRAQAKKMGNEALKKTCAPEGYVSVSDFAESLGTKRGVVTNFFKEKKIQLDSFRTENGKNAKYLSEDLCEAFIEEGGYKQPPEGYISVIDTAESLGVGKNTIREYFKKQNIKIDKYKGPDDCRPIEYLSPEQLDKFTDGIVFEEAPDDYLTMGEFAARNKIGDGIVRKFFKDVKLKPYRGINGLPTRYLSPQNQELFFDKHKELISKNKTSEKAPEGYLTIPVFAKRLGIDRNTVDRFIKDQHIELNEYRGFNGNARYLSPDEQDFFIKEREDILSLEDAPEDYLSIDEFSKMVGMSRTTIYGYFGNLEEQTIHDNLDNLEEQIKCFKGKNQKRTWFLSPSAQKRFIEAKKNLLSLERPPEGYLTIYEFASLYNVNAGTVEKYAVDELQNYICNNGLSARYLSPEQQADVLSGIEKSTAGTSFPENAIAYYLVQSGKKIQQGVRPDWLKNPNTGKNLELDIFVDPPGIGIEYDGMHWHQDVERDIRKDNIAQKNGYQIIHIREDGCPEMPEGLYNIKRKSNNDDTDLGECIKRCFEILDIPVSDIDVAHDKKEIMAFMRQRVLDKLDSARTFEELSVVS